TLMRVVFSPEARQEFQEAERYYERQVPGLGARFRTEEASHWYESGLGRCPAPASGARSGA
ncbi:MAG TPA: hypothetical protein VMQ45_06325, partial [Burkholderiaceae bacterium]|nr:hypothetical protein [Burkholderiaceae bacterium]